MKSFHCFSYSYSDIIMLTKYANRDTADWLCPLLLAACGFLFLLATGGHFLCHRKKVMIVALNEQRKLFVNEYIKLRCKNATQAAINAGYSEKTAQSQASQILKDSYVQEYLEQQKSEISKGLQQEFVYDALEARNVMYEILKNPAALDKDKIAVAKDFLDRAGFKPTESVSVSGVVNNPMAGLTTEDLKKLIYDG